MLVAQNHCMISRQEKIISQSGCVGTPLPLPQSLYEWAYTDITTKISRINRLQNLLSNGALLVH